MSSGQSQRHPLTGHLVDVVKQHRRAKERKEEIHDELSGKFRENSERNGRAEILSQIELEEEFLCGPPYRSSGIRY